MCCGSGLNWIRSLCGSDPDEVQFLSQRLDPDRDPYFSSGSDQDQYQPGSTMKYGILSSVFQIGSDPNFLALKFGSGFSFIVAIRKTL